MWNFTETSGAPTPGLTFASRARERTDMPNDLSGSFTAENFVGTVTARNARAKDAQLRQVLDVIVRKLHEAVKEIEPTGAQWLKAILFLTANGQKSDEWRQEFILFSDVPGSRCWSTP